MIRAPRPPARLREPILRRHVAFAARHEGYQIAAGQPRPAHRGLANSAPLVHPRSSAKARARPAKTPLLYICAQIQPACFLLLSRAREREPLMKSAEQWSEVYSNRPPGGERMKNCEKAPTLPSC